MMPLLPSLSEVEAHLPSFPSRVTSLVHFLWLSRIIVARYFSVPWDTLAHTKSQACIKLCFNNSLKHVSPSPLRVPQRQSLLKNQSVYKSPLSSTACHRYRDQGLNLFFFFDQGLNLLKNKWMQGGERVLGRGDKGTKEYARPKMQSILRTHESCHSESPLPTFWTNWMCWLFQRQSW